MTDKYILDGHNAKPEPDIIAWGHWYDKNYLNRHVKNEEIGSDVRVSTVFLGIDHSFGHGPPLLFETMVFGGPLDGEQRRYSTWGEAEAGHAAVMAEARTAAASTD